MTNLNEELARPLQERLQRVAQLAQEGPVYYRVFYRERGLLAEQQSGHWLSCEDFETLIAEDERDGWVSADLPQVGRVMVLNQPGFVCCSTSIDFVLRDYASSDQYSIVAVLTGEADSDFPDWNDCTYVKPSRVVYFTRAEALEVLA